MGVASFTHHHGPWTVADVLALPEDRSVRYELLGESLVMSPAPGLRHQRASYRLHVALDAAAQAAEAPVEVLEAVNVTLPSGLVVPDIVVADAGATAEDASASTPTRCGRSRSRPPSPGSTRRSP
ncbi:Uma2 family endonuclease [Streptomyces sp. NPDC048057]|uniref:Uma2 family endonuclease n=1 Tax=Streptomyces sp. NPDC048057 TaxID=3155628 RepID=UPI0033CE7D8F